MRVITTGLAMIGAAMIATSASASSLSISGTGVAPTTLPNNFGPLTTFDSVSGDFIAVDLLDPLFNGLAFGDAVTTFDDTSAPGTFGLSIDPGRDVVFTYLGREAGFSNDGNSTVGLVSGAAFNTKTSEFGDQFRLTAASGLPVPFVFEANEGAKSAVNGGVIGAGMAISFSEIFNNGRSVLAFLDDSGSGPDSDIDDIVVRIDVVPLPAAVWMFLAALGGLGFMSRKRTVAAAA